MCYRVELSQDQYAFCKRMPIADSCQMRLLDRENLTNVCSLLDPVTLARFSCTSREMRDASCTNSLWERHSRNRWHNTNANLCCGAEGLLETQQDRSFAQHNPSRQQLRNPLVDFRRLYANNNGWTPLKFQEPYRFGIEAPSAFCVSRAPARQFCSGTGDAVYTVDTEVHLWSTGDSSKEGLGLTCRAKGSELPISIADVASITEVATGVVAIGGSNGRICLRYLRPDAGASSHHDTTWQNGSRYHHHQSANKAVATTP